MAWRDIFRPRTAARIEISSDNTSVFVSINKAWLRQAALSSRDAARLLESTDGEGDGDWGGADYPVFEPDKDQTAALIAVLAAKP